MVSIITINYNGYEDTCELIDSIYQYEIYPFEIIVVDNASLSDDGKKLAKKYPSVTVIFSKNNLGFAGGNNLGYRYAKGEYILYMNNDMKIMAPFLTSLVERLNFSTLIGAVSPKIKYTYAPDVIQYAGYTPLNPILIRNDLVGVNEKDEGQYDVASETAAVHGACMLTSRSVLDKAGTMTDVYFLFYEELDWSMQLRCAGYRVWYEPDACVYHKESMTIKRGTSSRHYYLTRSRILFARRNNKGMDKLLSCVYLGVVVLAKNVLFNLTRGDWEMLVASWRGMVHGLTDNCKSAYH